MVHDVNWTALLVPLGPASDSVRTLGVYLALGYTWSSGAHQRHLLKLVLGDAAALITAAYHLPLHG